MVQHLGTGGVEAVHEPVLAAAPGRVPPAAEGLVAVAAGVAGDPVGMPAHELGVRCGQEGGEPDARPPATGGDVSRQRLEAGRELRVGVEPVTDGRLVPVVELEDVEGPPVGGGEVAAEVGLGDLVEVVVPAAPADLEGGGHPCARGPADAARPTAQQLGRRPLLASCPRDPVQRTPLPRAELGTAEEGLDPQLGAPLRRPDAGGRCRHAGHRRRTRERSAGPCRVRPRRPGPCTTPSAARRRGRAGRRRGTRPGRRGSRRAARGRRPRRGRRRPTATTTGSHGGTCAVARWRPARARRRPAHGAGWAGSPRSQPTSRTRRGVPTSAPRAGRPRPRSRPTGR